MKKIKIDKLSLKKLAVPILILGLTLAVSGLFRVTAAAATLQGQLKPVSLGDSYPQISLPGGSDPMPPVNYAPSVGSHITYKTLNADGSPTNTCLQSGPSDFYCNSMFYPDSISSICSDAKISGIHIEMKNLDIPNDSTSTSTLIIATSHDNQNTYISDAVYQDMSSYMNSANQSAVNYFHDEFGAYVYNKNSGISTNRDLVIDQTIGTSDPLSNPSNFLSNFKLMIYGGTSQGKYIGLDYPTIEISYTGCSSPITTDPDTSTTLPSTPVTINVLGNDGGSNLKVSKIDNQDIVVGQTITLTNGSGTVKLNTDGTITFTPASGFTGESSFNYSITDGTNTVDTGAVKITVFEPGKGSQSSIVKVPNSGFVVVSLLLIPIGIGSIAYLFISHKHKNLIRKKSER